MIWIFTKKPKPDERWILRKDRNSRARVATILSIIKEHGEAERVMFLLGLNDKLCCMPVRIFKKYYKRLRIE